MPAPGVYQIVYTLASIGSRAEGKANLGRNLSGQANLPYFGWVGTLVGKANLPCFGSAGPEP